MLSGKQLMQAPVATEQQAAGPGETNGDDASEAAAVQQQDDSQSSEPLPLPYLQDADGRKQPLPGAKSIFIRGKLHVLISNFASSARWEAFMHQPSSRAAVCACTGMKVDVQVP